MAKQPPRRPSAPIPAPQRPTIPSRPQPGGSPGRNDQNKGIARPPSIRPPKKS